jgi:transcription-repair coupling factor (superfamily II helicase)
MQPIVVVLPTQKEVGSFAALLDDCFGAIGVFEPKAMIFPSFSCWGNDRFVNPVFSRRQRVAVLAALQEPSAPPIIVTTFAALAQGTTNPREFREEALMLNVGTEYDFESILARVEDLGYQKTARVEEEGFWAVRGGIIDVFPASEKDPLRFEFTGDELTSIRFFSTENQRTKKELSAIRICAATETVTSRENRKADTQTLFNCLLAQNINHHDRDGMMSAFSQGLRFSGFDMFAPIFRREQASLLDHLDGKTLFFFPKSIEQCAHAYAEFLAQNQAAYLRDIEAKRPAIPPIEHFANEAIVESRIHSDFDVFEFGNPFDHGTGPVLRLEGKVSIPGAPNLKQEDKDRFAKWVAVFKEIRKDGAGSVAILVRTKENSERVVNLLNHHRLHSEIRENLFSEISTGNFAGSGIFVGRGFLNSHLWLAEAELLIVTEEDLFGVIRKKKKSAPSRLRNYLSSFRDLKVSDLVVHLSHGIGRYLGMTCLTLAGGAGDYLVLEYANNDKIYLPVEKLNLLQRYGSSSDTERSAPLDKLGSQSWSNRKARVKQIIADMAEKLLKIQAKRYLARAHVYGAPGEAYAQFEEDFPYQETDDQLKVLAEIDSDLRSDRLMDRLVVGDVGFGKTEVALRAALRAVLEGLQVLVLVPTTVLCYQHFQTFRNRLSKHGVEVAQVNRFVKGPVLKETIEGLKAGRVDVVIGTHRLLSKDVVPKRLGLLIVDEEQRFGVTHKERIKEMRTNADVLTLTATPIPRTLHMAMVGLRQISIIASPPDDRLSIKTYISKFDALLMKDAIDHEIRRGGQVFFVHNRVENIDEMANFVRKLRPETEVRIAHGQMGENELEEVILDFIEQKFSVLVCTTIIESGIDMPNVNTLIVLRADMFGLAQLYQLRGRVGRSNVQAYAYFFTPDSEKITEEAARRLEVLAANQDLGSGFQIASHDLEIRGAGNLLGAEQSGQVNAVGIELYTEMLESVIRGLRGEQAKEKHEIELKTGISAVIPVSYIESERDRLNAYKTMFSAEKRDDLDELRESISDQYGLLPPEMLRLFKIAEIRRILRGINAVHMIPGTNQFFEIKYGSLSEQQIANMIAIVAEQPEKYRLLSDYRLVLSIKAISNSAPTAVQDGLLDGILELLEPLTVRLEV